MENPQIIALVAIAISVISIGLVAANVFNLQTTLINLSTSLVEQSQTIKSLNQQQNATQQVIEEQEKNILKMQDNITNLTSEIKSLEDRITSLEQRLQLPCMIPEGCPPPTPQKPVYFPSVVKFYNAAGGVSVTENRVFKQLPSTLSADHWVADFDYKFTASSIPVSKIFALAPAKDDPQDQTSSNEIIIEHGHGVDQLLVLTYPSNTQSTGIPISLNTKYYVSLEKTPTLLTLRIFSDPARTHQISGSPVTLDMMGADFSNLNYIQHDACKYCGESRTLTAEVDNMKIFVIDSLGNKQTFFEDNYSSNSGWTQIGTSIAVNGSFVPQMPLVYDYSRSLP